MPALLVPAIIALGNTIVCFIIRYQKRLRCRSLSASRTGSQNPPKSVRDYRPLRTRCLGRVQLPESLPRMLRYVVQVTGSHKTASIGTCVLRPNDTLEGEGLIVKQERPVERLTANLERAEFGAPVAESCRKFSFSIRSTRDEARQGDAGGCAAKYGKAGQEAGIGAGIRASATRNRKSHQYVKIALGSAQIDQV